MGRTRTNTARNAQRIIRAALKPALAVVSVDAERDVALQSHRPRRSRRRPGAWTFSPRLSQRPWLCAETGSRLFAANGRGDLVDTRRSDAGISCREFSGVLRQPSPDAFEASDLANRSRRQPMLC